MSDKSTYNFEFYPANDIENSVRLSFDVDDLPCGQLHKMCKAFAYALGYLPTTIEKYFGPDKDDWLN